MTAPGVCVYCKTPGDNVVLFETGDIYGDLYTINRCNRCRAFFLSPTPTAEQLARAYDASYYGRDQEKFGGFTEQVLDYFRRDRAARVAGYLPKNANILDVGCGNGRFLNHMRLYGQFNLFGIEKPGKAAERAAKYREINLKVGDLQPDDYPDDFFNAVTLFHVFEHLSEPASTLAIIGRILKKGGICVMSFPNIDSFQARLFRGRWLHLDPPRHLFYFTPRDFAEIASGFGLAVEKTSFVSPEQNPYGMIQGILNCLSGKREILFESLKGNTQYVSDVSRLTLFMHRMFFVLTYPLFVVSDWIESLFGKGASVQFILRKQ
jgi:SAM-dependent methyltransferase